MQCTEKQGLIKESSSKKYLGSKDLQNKKDLKLKKNTNFCHILFYLDQR